MDLRYLRQNSDIVWERTLEHLQLSLTALAIALPVALLISLLAIRFRPLTFSIVTLLGVLYTLPSLVVLVLLIPSQGIGDRPVLIMLVMYAQFFLVRNIVAGIRGVDPAATDAARGLGMTPFQVYWKLTLPLALPVILSGVRIALVTIVGLAVFGGLISAGGLGRILFEGINRDYPSMVLAGIIAIVALSLVIDLVLRLVEMTTPAVRARRAGRA
jgi:osmoprotectant transport system permease protein